MRRPASLLITIAATAAVVLTSVGVASAAPNQPFASCTEALDAGYSDIVVGDPGYSEWLDTDLDGVACESTGADAGVPVDAADPAPAVTVAPEPQVPVEVQGTNQEQLAQTGSEDIVMFVSAIVLIGIGLWFGRLGYERLAWIAGSRRPHVRYTIDSREPIKRKR